MNGLDIACFGGVENGQVMDIYFGDESGFVYQLDTGDSDDGDPIERYFVNVFSGNNPEQGVTGAHEYRKQFQGFDTYIRPTEDNLSMIPYYATDLMDDLQVRTSGNYTALSEETVNGWTGDGTKHKKNRFFGLSGKTLALKWEHNTVAQNFVFQPSLLRYDYRSKIDIV